MQHPLLCAPRSAQLTWCTRVTWRTSYANCARNICATYMRQIHARCHAGCARHIRESDANVARTRNVTSGPLCKERWTQSMPLGKLNSNSYWLLAQKWSLLLFCKLGIIVTKTPGCGRGILSASSGYSSCCGMHLNQAVSRFTHSFHHIHYFVPGCRIGETPNPNK
jgi:hypothetical protein